MKELLRKKSVKIALLLIILLVAAVIIGFNAQSAQRQKEYDSHIQAAEKYLTELDYEKAIAEYILAYEIEPSEKVLDALEQTYLAYAQSYVDAGDYERAISILEEGYSQIGRESLQERVEEVQLMQIRQAEEEAKEAEEAKAEEIKRLVEEKEEEMSNVSFLYGRCTSGDVFIPNTQVEELCRPLVELLEQYKAFYPDDYFFTWDYLPECYYLLGEYELCLETRRQLHELQLMEWEQRGSDSESYPYSYATEVIEIERQYDNGTVTYITYNEYGEKIKLKRIIDGHLREEIYEYGENGRIAQDVVTGDGASGEGYTTTFEYDPSGRILKQVTNYNNPTRLGDKIVTLTKTYTYDDKGVTEHTSKTKLDGSEYTESVYYELDEYGVPISYQLLP